MAVILLTKRVGRAFLFPKKENKSGDKIHKSSVKQEKQRRNKGFFAVLFMVTRTGIELKEKITKRLRL
jgi:hypothetical protein